MNIKRNLIIALIAITTMALPGISEAAALKANPKMGKSTAKKLCKVCHADYASRFKGYTRAQIKAAFKSIPDMAILKKPSAQQYLDLAAYFKTIK